MDFSENYSLRHQDQIESAYFSQKQITLHPVYLYHHAPDSTEENIKIQKRSHCNDIRQFESQLNSSIFFHLPTPEVHQK